MDVEINPVLPPVIENPPTDGATMETERINENGVTFENIVEHLMEQKNVYLKSQQRGESDINREEKEEIIRNIFNKGTTNFLIRFGRYLTLEHLKYFEQFENNAKESYEIKNLLRNLKHRINEKKSTVIRNRRYAALRHMVENDSYFSETEMMKRNPLLYEQLVGQYLTDDEKKERDVAVGEKTLVGILMEGLERDEAESKRKTEEMAEIDTLLQEDESDNEDVEAAQENSCTSKEKPFTPLWGEYTQQSASSSQWGEIPNEPKDKSKQNCKRKRALNSFPDSRAITAPARRLLKEEFITTMYENFLEGKDDFDYTNVDDNEDFDNLELIDRDEEEKYFDSEEPDNYEDENMDPESKIQEKKEDSSEDELDIYMSALNQHPAVCQLSKDIEKL